MWLDKGLGWGLTPFYGAYHGYRCLRGRETAQQWYERWGYTQKRRPSSLVWMHAASLGESCTALGLFDLLKSMVPHVHLLLTTGTETSRARCIGLKDTSVIHHRMPWDMFHLWHRFFQYWRPQVGMIIESELWPFCLRYPGKFPLFWVDGRLSDQGLRRWSRAKGLLSGMMQRFDQISVSQKHYVPRIETFYRGDMVSMPSGKWLVRPPQSHATYLKQWQMHVGHRSVWCVANIHPPEEKILHQIYHQVKQRCPDALLVVVPRYPHKPLRLPGQGQWSTSLEVLPQTDVYGIRAFNVLGVLYAISTVVWMGGSFFPKGGHNPLEAAHHGCWPVSGPYVFNNADTWQRLHRVYPSIYTNIQDISSAIGTLLQEALAQRSQRYHAFSTLHQAMEHTWKQWVERTVCPHVS